MRALAVLMLLLIVMALAGDIAGPLRRIAVAVEQIAASQVVR